MQKYKAIIEYAKPFREVFEGDIPNYNGAIQEMKAVLTRMPVTFRRQLYLWLKKEF